MNSQDIAAPIIGLRIQLDRTRDVACGDCGQCDVIIGPGTGPHAASLRCASCDRHRGWLPLAFANFLSEMVCRFGRPTETITVRDTEFARANASNAESRTPHNQSAP
jgi:hypothetical protein